MSPIQILSGREIGDLSRLEPLVREIFGPGDRPEGWFARKLRRECVEPELSTVAVHDGRPCGYVLVGRPLPRMARTAGVGVLPPHRGAGLASTLIEEAALRAKELGLTRLRTLAEPARVGFYERLGFGVVRNNHSLMRFATGSGTVGDPPRRWADVGDCIHEVAAWMEAAWERTPASARRSVRLDGVALAHVSTEGSAYLVHRLNTNTLDDAAVVEAAKRLLDALPAPRPVLLYGCNVVSSITSSLMRAGWDAVQTSAVMERSLSTFAGQS